MHIHPDISHSLGRQKERDLTAAAERHRLAGAARRAAKSKSALPAVDVGHEITIRLATSSDLRSLAHLASLDSSRPLVGEILVAEVEGKLWAACSLDDGTTIGDPFRATQSARALLELRREQIAAAQRTDGRRQRRKHGLLRQLRFGA